MAILENGNNTAGLANVDADFNLQVTTPQVNTRVGGETGAPNYVGAVRIFSENDAGTLSGSAYLQSPWTSSDQNLQVGQLTPLMDYTFNGAAQDTAVWSCTLTNMTITQGSGFVNLNASNIGTTGSGAVMVSKRFVNLNLNGGLRFSMIGNITLAPQANAVWYAGIGTPASAIAQPTDGVWFQYSSAGLIGVLSYNGSVVQTGALPVVSPLTIAPNTSHLFQFRVFDRNLTFLYDGNVLGSLTIPTAQAVPFLSDSLPVFLQQVNTGTVTGGTFMQFKVGAVAVDQIDSNLGKPYPHVQASKGLIAYQGLQGGTMGSTALFTNSLAAGAGVAMTNTTAALGTGLGGQFTYLPTLAANTDGILCSYQVPAGTINQTPRTLYITGVRIQSFVSATLTGGPCYMAYSLAFGHTALPLNTAETASFVTASTKAPRRIALGLETFPAAAALGVASATNTPVFMQFASPIVVNPGEFVAIAAKNIAGTVTTLGTITSFVTFDGYFE